MAKCFIFNKSYRNRISLASIDYYTLWLLIGIISLISLPFNEIRLGDLISMFGGANIVSFLVALSLYACT